MKIWFLLSLFSPLLAEANQLGRRKGGGGRGGGRGSKGSKTGSGSSGDSKSHVPISSLAGGKSSATAYGNGGGHPVSIPSGQLFAGRTAGGASRQQVYGSWVYGSGYPGFQDRGVVGRGFPFWFWPLIWGTLLTEVVIEGAYLHEISEYGRPDNSSRPGGALTKAQFQSNTSSTLFHVLADNSTLVSLIDSIRSNCTALSSNSSTVPAMYNGSTTSDPQPEQAVQYYRASSVVLTLYGYNNSAALSDNANATVTPLPTDIDMALLSCLNATIGDGVPLVDAAVAGSSASVLASKVGTLGLAWIVLCFVKRFI